MIGADDYIVKPFASDELVARLQTHLLRRANTSRTTLTLGRMILDQATHQVHLGDQSARLTQREAELLALFMANANKPLTRYDLFHQVWVGQGGTSLNVVDVYVGYLRAKLADLARFGGPSITTVRSKGFELVPKDQAFRH